MPRPAAQRNVIVLRLFHDLPFSTIARTLGVNEATARTHAYHGLTSVADGGRSSPPTRGGAVECGQVRESLSRMGFGLSPDRLMNEVQRHLATCTECRQELVAWGRGSLNRGLPMLPQSLWSAS